MQKTIQEIKQVMSIVYFDSYFVISTIFMMLNFIAFFVLETWMKWLFLTISLCILYHNSIAITKIMNRLNNGKRKTE